MPDYSDTTKGLLLSSDKKSSVLYFAAIGLVVWPIISILLLFNYTGLINTFQLVNSILIIWIFALIFWIRRIFSCGARNFLIYMWVLITLAILTTTTSLFYNIWYLSVFRYMSLVLALYVIGYGVTALLGSRFNLTYVEYIVYSSASVLSVFGILLLYLFPNFVIFFILIITLQFFPTCIAPVVSADHSKWEEKLNENT